VESVRREKRGVEQRLLRTCEGSRERGGRPRQGEELSAPFTASLCPAGKEVREKIQESAFFDLRKRGPRLAPSPGKERHFGTWAKKRPVTSPFLTRGKKRHQSMMVNELTRGEGRKKKSWGKSSRSKKEKEDTDRAGREGIYGRLLPIKRRARNARRSSGQKKNFSIRTGKKRARSQFIELRNLPIISRGECVDSLHEGGRRKKVNLLGQRERHIMI